MTTKRAHTLTFGDLSFQLLKRRIIEMVDNLAIDAACLVMASLWRKRGEDVPKSAQEERCR